VKRQYWKTSGPSWEWENWRQIYVYQLEGVRQRDIESVVTIINDVIREFDLPLSALNGNSVRSEDTFLINQLIAKCRQEKYVDFDGVEFELEKMRKTGVLPYGVVILIDHTRYEFRNPPNTKQPAIYGCASPEGLIVLRIFDIQNAVRHEFGHMIGLGEHHENCVMDWHCSYGEFCHNCKRRIKEIWNI